MKREGVVVAGAILEIIEGAIFLIINAWMIAFMDRLIQAFNMKETLLIPIIAILIIIPLSMIIGSILILCLRYKNKKDLVSNGIANICFCAFFVYLSWRAALLIYFIPITLGITSAILYFCAKCEIQNQNRQRQLAQQSVTKEEVAVKNYQKKQNYGLQNKKIEKKNKKIIWIVLFVVVVVIVFIAIFGVFSKNEEKGFLYKKTSDTTLEITEYIGENRVVEIPEMIDGKKVTSIGSAAFYASQITSIKIPSTVTNIGSDAFAYCANLESIEIPRSVKKIENGALRECNRLYSVTLPFVGDNGNNGYFGYIFGAKDYTENSNHIPLSLEIVTITGGTRIADGAFYNSPNNNQIRSINLPETITSIGSNAFYCCSQLTNIKIPSSVTTIGKYAFKYCGGLASVEIEENSQLISIDEYAFYSCTDFRSIKIPSSVETVGKEAFYSCKKLKTVSFGKDSRLKKIGEGAFSYCDSLESVIFGDNSQLQIIENDVFANCGSLKTITFGENSKLTDIGDGVFVNCNSLISIVIPNSVKKIGSNSFSGCDTLENVEMSSNIMSLGYGVFDNCPNLVYNIVDNVKYCGNSQNKYIVAMSIVDSSAERIDIKNGCKMIHRYAFEWLNVSSIVIPDSVTCIGDFAFYSCHGFSSIVIPDSVINMGYWVFSHDDITIYCEATSKPIGWNDGWKSSGGSIVWGYKS